MATPRPKKSSLRSVKYRQNSFGGFEALDLDLPGPHINRDFLERRSTIENDDSSRRTTNYSRGADSILEEVEGIRTVPTGTGVLTTRNKAKTRQASGAEGQNGTVQRIAEWTIHWWKSPLIALMTLIIGAGTAIGHHFYFLHLDGTEYRPGPAVWTQRYSLVLAFVVKVSLAATIQFTYFQVLWSSLKTNTKGTTLKGIDALFDVLSRSLSFLVVDMWKAAPLAVLIAIAIWILPLVSFVTPTSLTVNVSGITKATNCTIPKLDFSLGPSQTNAGGNGTRNRRQSQDLSRYTSTNLYQGPSALATKIGTLSAYDGSPLSFDSPCGLNCSYTTTFYAPAWRCNRTSPMELNAPWQNYADNPLEDPIPWFPSEQVHPGEDTANDSSNWDTGYTYVTWTDEDSGYFWLGHSTPKYGSFPDNWPEGSGNMTYLDLFDVEQFYCGSWNASYTVNVEFENGSRKNLSISNLDYVNNVTTSRRALGDISRFDEEAGYARTAHVSIFEVLSGLLNGTIRTDPGGIDVFSYDLKIPSIPSLIEEIASGEGNNTTDTEQLPQQPFRVRRSIRDAVEELSQNYTLSLLSQRQLQFLRYDAPDAISNGDGVCTTTNVRQQWEYHPVDLIIAYSVAVGAALLALILGYATIIKHGVVMGSQFSTVLFTTRNRDLDDIAQGNCLGSEVVQPKDVGKMKLRFGEVIPPGDNGLAGHTGFGLMETTGEIRKRARYS